MVDLERRASVVTFLEMTTPRPATRSWPDPALRIERLVNPTARFYRYLYDAIGTEWQWHDRKLMHDDDLRAILDAPGIEVHLLSEGGVPMGYGELDRRAPDEVKIDYFGLLPEAVGRGLGRWFLEQITARAWRSGPKRVWLRTCDLDHPRALGNYEAAGFCVFDRRTEELLYRAS